MIDDGLRKNNTQIACPKCNSPVSMRTIVRSGKLGEPKEDEWLWGSEQEETEWNKRNPNRPFRAAICNIGNWYHLRIGDNTDRLVYMSTKHKG